MADFNKAWEATKPFEGGMEDNPADRGGITNGGISLRFLKDLGDADRDGYLDGDVNHDGIVDRIDVLNLTSPDKKRLAYREFWVKMRCDELVHQGVGAKVFDLALNMGPGASALILQRGLRAVLHPVKEDGHIGPVTIAAANAVDGDHLLVAMRSEAAAIYRMIVAKDQTQATFANGWLSRAYA
jgi:lysozyme family protein